MWRRESKNRRVTVGEGWVDSVFLLWSGLDLVWWVLSSMWGWYWMRVNGFGMMVLAAKVLAFVKVEFGVVEFVNPV